MEAKNLRIIFFGTPEIAAIELEHLVKQGYNVVAVVTNVDKQIGRGQKISFCEVKQKAIELGIKNILQPQSMKEDSFVCELKSLKPDVQIVVAFRMMPKKVYSLAPIGTFNLHTSLLPQYRGAAPINWAIINGEKQTGITTFLLNDKIDCGEILLQQSIEITEQTDFESLYYEMAEKGKNLIEETLNILSKGNYTTIKQQADSLLKPAPKIFKEDTYIDWNKKGEDIVNFIRGLSPLPSAKAVFMDEKTKKNYDFKIFKAKIISKDKKTQIGDLWIENKKSILVQTSDSILQLTDLQLSGKKRMPDTELVKGLRIESYLKSIKKK
ncbi:MAG: methionyl-tRNA formyltransferase [Bacteroidota bacterium]|nr:methionyl-tRNA formyltransferase [Bacteroidota bacterium]